MGFESDNFWNLVTRVTANWYFHHMEQHFIYVQGNFIAYEKSVRLCYAECSCNENKLQFGNVLNMLLWCCETYHYMNIGR
jgi:hypothetical protein